MLNQIIPYFSNINKRTCIYIYNLAIVVKFEISGTVIANRVKNKRS